MRRARIPADTGHCSSGGRRPFFPRVTPLGRMLPPRSTEHRGRVSFLPLKRTPPAPGPGKARNPTFGRREQFVHEGHDIIRGTKVRPWQVPGSSISEIRAEEPAEGVDS